MCCRNYHGDVDNGSGQVRKRRYISPKDSKAVVDLAKLAWPLMMRLKHGNLKMKIVGDGLERFELLKGDRVVICPNHSSEDDAEVVFGLSKMVNQDFYFLTAHEIFHGNRGWNRLLLPYLGCYSIERGTKDIAAYRTTRDLLIANDHKLVVFPEGEISHFNEFVMPLERGVVQMSFAAIDHLDSKKTPGSVSILPVAIRYFFCENVNDQLDAVMDRIEKKLELCRLAGQSLTDRARRSLLQFISSLEGRFDLVSPPDTAFATRMALLRWAVLRRIAGRLDINLNENESQIENAHRIKSQLCDRFYHHSHKGAVRFTVTELKSMYKELFSIIDFIAVEHSSLFNTGTTIGQDELSEVIELLETALFDSATVHGSKLILIAIGEPICLQEYYTQYKENRGATVRAIDDRVRMQLGKMLEELTQAFQSKQY